MECVEGEVLPISGPAMGGGGALSATVQSPGPRTLDLYKFSPFFPPHVPFLYHSLDCVDRCIVFVCSLIMFMQLYIRSAPSFKIPHLCNLWYLGIFVAQVAMHCP